jgi:hypothetical protein
MKPVSPSLGIVDGVLPLGGIVARDQYLKRVEPLSMVPGLVKRQEDRLSSPVFQRQGFNRAVPTSSSMIAAVVPSKDDELDLVADLLAQ